jgi:hypothetical protein
MIRSKLKYMSQMRIVFNAEVGIFNAEVGIFNAEGVFLTQRGQRSRGAEGC